MSRTQQSSDWLKSTEVQKALCIDSCELMHLREAGHLRYTKKGNAFLYAKPDVARLKSILKVHPTLGDATPSTQSAFGI